MRNFFYKFRFLMVAFLVVGITSLSLVNAKNDNKDGIFSEQIGRLAEQIGRLADAITGKTEVKEEVVDSIEKNELQKMGTDIPNPDCLDNFQSWQQSANCKDDAPWNLNLFISDNYHQPFLGNLIDLNGDGLLDYIYMEKKRVVYTYPEYLSYNQESSCVLLNNGNGWDIEYRCFVGQKEINGTRVPYYYGDCAQ